MMKFQKNQFIRLSAQERLSLAAVFLISFSSFASYGVTGGELCQKWATPEVVGQLDSVLIKEASGLAASRRFPRLYFVNDSGDGPYFYVTNLNASSTRRIEIKKFTPFDVEEISLGSCPDLNGSCLAIADIGDNREKRKDIEIIFVREEEKFADEVSASARVVLNYEDRAHNAEAFANLPNGDLVVVTKEEKKKSDGKRALEAHVFRIKNSDLQKAILNQEKGVLQEIGEIDLPKITGDDGFGGLVTGMSVSTDGKRFLLLSYDKIVEFKYDLGMIDSLPKNKKMKPSVDFNLITTTTLPQQESVTYEPGDRNLLYSSESVAKFPILARSAPVPLMRIRCEK